MSRRRRRYPRRRRRRRGPTADGRSSIAAAAAAGPLSPFQHGVAPTISDALAPIDAHCTTRSHRTNSDGSRPSNRALKPVRLQHSKTKKRSLSLRRPTSQPPIHKNDQKKWEQDQIIRSTRVPFDETRSAFDSQNNIYIYIYIIFF